MTYRPERQALELLRVLRVAVSGPAPSAIIFLLPAHPGFVIVKCPCLRYNPFVRLDLFLKTTRLVKRRTVAQEMCDAGRVLVNGSPAKPAKEVRPGDILRLSYASRTISVEVLAVPASSKNVRTAPEELCRVTGEQRLQHENNT